MSGRIVIVDDDEFDMRMIRRSLTAMCGEFDLVEVVDSLSAADAIETHQPALAVLDLKMPKLDGFGVLHQIRATTSSDRLPVIVLSGSDVTTDREKA